MKQESVWEYPRPAICEPFKGALRCEIAGKILAETTKGYRALETSHPPTYYFPPGDVDMSMLKMSGHSSHCEWKGKASYYDFSFGDRTVSNIAWTYLSPTSTFIALKNFLCFYPSKLDACYVNDEQAHAQEGDFYGGWITSNIKGPFKGGAGTWGW